MAFRRPVSTHRRTVSGLTPNTDAASPTPYLFISPTLSCKCKVFHYSKRWIYENTHQQC